MPESSNIPGRLIWFPNRRTVRLVVGAGKEVNERGPNKMGNQIKISAITTFPDIYFPCCYSE